VAKAHKKEVDDRVTHVISLLTVGARPTDIVHDSTVNGWGIEERQIWKYIGKAYKYFETQANINRDEELGTILEQYKFLYLQMLRAKDYRGAGTILDKRAELIGLKTLRVQVGELKVKVDYEDNIKSDDLV
jgi:hypothetical protein